MTTEIVQVIIKLKAGKTLRDAAVEALALLGAGGNPDATQDEAFLGFCNTPQSGPYARVQCGEAYAQALEYLQEGETCELVVVLWPGVEEPVLDLPEGVELGRFAS